MIIWVAVANNSPSQDSSNTDDHFQSKFIQKLCQWENNFLDSPLEQLKYLDELMILRWTIDYSHSRSFRETFKEIRELLHWQRPPRYRQRCHLANHGVEEWQSYLTLSALPVFMVLQSNEVSTQDNHILTWSSCSVELSNNPPTRCLLWFFHLEKR